METTERFWSKVDKSGDCWVWTACRIHFGYGQFYVSPQRRHVRAHRYAYELLVGPIPDGLVLDHLCSNPPCVNPAHLEPVRQRENVMRSRSHVATNPGKTHCPKGHPYDEANTYVRPNGKRDCRTCLTASRRRYRARGGS